MPGFPRAAAVVDQRRLLRRARRPAGALQAIGNRNWLGTDDQGRDVLARLIYGFRISVLFGLLLTILSSIVGVTAGAMQGYFGGPRRSRLPALPGDLVVDPVAVRAHHHIFGAGAGLLDAARRAPAVPLGLLVGVVRAEFLRGRNFEYITAARALGLSNARSCSSTCCPTPWWRR